MRQRHRRPPHNRGKQSGKPPSKRRPSNPPSPDLRSHAPPSEPAAERAAGTPVAGRRKVVLVLEDFATIGGLVAGLVRQAGYRAVRAWSLAEAVRLARGRRPDLILLDLNAPTESVAQTYRALRSEAATRSCPMLVVSAAGLPVLATEEGDAPAEIVAKPFHIDVMLNAVRRVLGDPEVELQPLSYPSQDNFLHGY